MLGSGETGISRDPSLPYAVGDGSRADVDTTRVGVQTGVLARISGLEDGKEVTRPDEKREEKRRHSAPKKGDPIDRGVYMIPLKESVSMRSRTRTKQVYGWTEATRERH